MYLYCITNLINGKQYIGITNNYKKRWSNHKSKSSKGLTSLAIQKYGVENFKFEILLRDLTVEEANEKEIEYIQNYNTLTPNGYNISIGGGLAPALDNRRYGADNNNAHLTEEEAQYILDHRDIPIYVLYEDFNEKLSYSAFKNIYHHRTYTNLTTDTPIYPYNVEFSAQFTSGNKLDYGDIVELRERYANLEYWENVYRDYKDLYPDKWTFWQIYTGKKFKLVMPEVFTPENKSKHHSFGCTGEKNGRAKLTEADVLNIRQLHKDGVSNSEIYKLFPQVTPNSIREVINGHTWKHLL